MKRFHTFLLCLIVLTLVATGCGTKSSATKCGPCPLFALVLPNINFRVVDKTTGQDLFFGASAPYKFNQLAVHHIINGKADTAYLRVDTLNQNFNLLVNPVHVVDTITMNIGNKPQDRLLFNIAVTGGCCSYRYLASVTFNGQVVYNKSDGNKVVVLAK
jgi:hypothetical protein